MTIKRVPPGDTFQRMDRPLTTGVEPYPGDSPEAVKRLVAIGYKHDGRVLDNPSIGASIVLRIPAAATATATGITGPPASASNTVSFTPLFDIQAKNPVSPEVLTVQINPPSIVAQSDFIGQLCDIKMRLEWGTPGGQMSADIDIKNGTSVTVLGTFVRASVILQIFANPTTFNSITIGGSVSYGAFSSHNPSTWTGTIDNQVAGAATITRFTVPRLARDVVVYSLDTLTGLSTSVDIFFQNSMGPAPAGGFSGTSGRTTQPAATLNPAYRLPGEGGLLGIQNPAANPNPTQVTVIFGLAI